MSVYREFAPPPGLAGIAECLWFLTPEETDGAVAIERIFPDGATDIVVSRGQVDAHGPARSFRVMMVKAPLAGVRIRRGAAMSVLRMSPTELAAGPVPVRALWGRQWQALEDSVSDGGTPASQLALLSRFLAERVAPGMQLDQVVRTAADHLQAFPNASLRHLTHRVGLSERQLRRRFRAHIGMGIKQYARIVRFGHFLDAARDHKRRMGVTLDGVDMALDHGFADQAHLIREVRAFSGLTPLQLQHAI
jgi:AraC-like DNA-binding protein